MTASMSKEADAKKLFDVVSRLSANADTVFPASRECQTRRLSEEATRAALASKSVSLHYRLDL